VAVAVSAALAMDMPVADVNSAPAVSSIAVIELRIEFMFLAPM
jgi:hypothetical protein